MKLSRNNVVMVTSKRTEETEFATITKIRDLNAEPLKFSTLYREWPKFGRRQKTRSRYLITFQIGEREFRSYYHDDIYLEVVRG